jgi:hypothetical protein
LGEGLGARALERDRNMRSFVLVALGLTFLMSGCSNSDDMAQKALEQQRINIDTLKLNQDKLDKINKKQLEMAKKEKDIQDALQKLESRKKELAKKEIDIKKLIEEEKKLSADIKENNEIAERYSEIAKKRASFLEELTMDWSKAAQSSLHLPGELDAELEKELDIAISQNRSSSETRAIYNKYYDLARTLWFNNINNYLQQNDVINIKSDDDFEKTAKETVEKFIKINTSEDDFDKIEKTYQKIQSDKKQATLR